MIKHSFKFERSDDTLKPHYKLSFLLFLATTFCFGGCSGQEQNITIKGVVTLDGKTLESGRVTYHPEKGRPWSGTIRSGGEYKLTAKGDSSHTVKGNYIVTVTKIDKSSSLPKYNSYEDELKGITNKSSAQKSAPWKVPSSYASFETSNLIVDLPEGSSQQDLKLTTGK